jgi:hypothetical protein
VSEQLCWDTMTTPSSISRDKSSTSVFLHYEAPEYSSILGKRGRGSGVDATLSPPSAKRPARQNQPAAEDDNHPRSSSRSDLSSSASDSDEDELETFETGNEVKQNKLRSNRGTSHPACFQRV